METVIAFDFTATERALAEFRESTVDSSAPGPPVEFYLSFLEAYTRFWKFLLAPDDTALKSSFKSSVDSAVKAAELGENTGNPDALLFRSCSYLLLALCEGEAGNPVASGFWFLKGIQAANRMADTFPNADPFLIIGCYDFYRSGGKTEFREYLGRTVREGYFFRELASYMEGKLLQRQDTAWDDSAAIFRKVWIKYPANPLFSFHLAKSYQHLGRYAESITLYDQSLQTALLEPAPVELLCITYFSKGQIMEINLHDPKGAVLSYTQAFETADRGVKRSVWFIPWSLLHIGYCNERMGNIEEALSAFSAVSKDDDREAWKRAQEAIGRIRAGQKEP